MNDRSRKIENRPITLDEEIKFHCQLWVNDVQFRHLPPFLKNLIKSSLDVIAVSKKTENLEIAGGDGENNKQVEKRKFIQIFRNLYLASTDYEYENTINGVTVNIIGELIKKLMDAGTTGEEYLHWFFEEFLEEGDNKKTFCPPGINIVLSSTFVNKYLILNKDKFRVRKKDAYEMDKKMKLLEIGNELFGEIPDEDSASMEECGGIIYRLTENKISFNKAAMSIVDFALKLKKNEIVQEIQELIKVE